MKINKTILLTTAFFLSSLLPQTCFADSAGSIVAQLVHNISHAHHAFGGLVFVAIFLLALKLRKKFTTKRVRNKSS